MNTARGDGAFVVGGFGVHQPQVVIDRVVEVDVAATVFVVPVTDNPSMDAVTLRSGRPGGLFKVE